MCCLPRSGSQLCVKLIEEYNKGYDLGEFFEGWNNSEYKIYDNNIQLENFITNFNVGFSINKNYKNRLKLLSNTNRNFPINLRLFLMNKYDKNILQEIIDCLHKNNFTFISLYRNVIDQLLSFMIASSYQSTFKKNIFTINSVADKKIFVNVIKLEPVLQHIYDSNLNFENNLKKLFSNISIKKIDYENITDDFSKLVVNKKYNYKGEKTVQGNYFDIIQNEKEVKNFIKEKFNILIV